MNDICKSFSTVSIREPCYNIYVEYVVKKGDFDMYTVRFQLELSGSEKRFLSKSFFYANQMHNQLVRYATNRLNALSNQLVMNLIRIEKRCITDA